MGCIFLIYREIFYAKGILPKELSIGVLWTFGATENSYATLRGFRTK
jgi:hypothetical protein